MKQDDQPTRSEKSVWTIITSSLTHIAFLLCVGFLYLTIDMYSGAGNFAILGYIVFLPSLVLFLIFGSITSALDHKFRSIFFYESLIQFSFAVLGVIFLALTLRDNDSFIVPNRLESESALLLFVSLIVPTGLGLALAWSFFRKSDAAVTKSMVDPDNPTQSGTDKRPHLLQRIINMNPAPEASSHSEVPLSDLSPRSEFQKTHSKTVWSVLVFLLLFLILLLAVKYVPGMVAVNQSHTGWSTFLKAKPITDLAIDPDGTVWAVSGNTLSAVNGKSIIAPVKKILTLEIDPQNRKWVGTFNGEVALLDGNGEWKVFSPAAPDPAAEQGYDMVRNIAVDSQGTAWIETYQGIAAIPVTHTESSYKILGPGFGISVDSQGQAWLADANGFFQPKLDGPTHFYTGAGGAPFTFDAQNQIWFYYYGELAKLSPSGELSTYSLNASSTSQIHVASSIAVDSQGQVWIGTNNGLIVFHPEDGIILFHPENSGLPSSQVNALTVDRSGIVWSATDEGLSSLDQQKQNQPQPNTAGKISPVLDLVLSIAAIILASGLGIAIAALIFSTRPKRTLSLNFLAGFGSFYAVNGLILLVFYLLIELFKLEGPSVMVLAPVFFLQPVLNLGILGYFGSQVKNRPAAFGFVWAFLVLIFAVFLLTPPGYFQEI